MDYKKYAKDLLGRKKNLVSALSAIDAELTSLESEKAACKCVAVNAGKEGADGAYSRRMLGVLARMEDCRMRRGVVERELMLIEKGMSGLNDYQKDLLEFFFVDKRPHTADGVMEHYYKERSTVYRDRNGALEEFTRSVYGVLQL